MLAIFSGLYYNVNGLYQWKFIELNGEQIVLKVKRQTMHSKHRRTFVL